MDGVSDTVVVFVAPEKEGGERGLAWVDTSSGALTHRMNAGRADATLTCIEPGYVGLTRPTEGDTWRSIEVFDAATRERIFRERGIGAPTYLEPGRNCFTTQGGSEEKSWRLPGATPLARCPSASEIWRFTSQFSFPFSPNHDGRAGDLRVSVARDLTNLVLRSHRGKALVWTADLELRSPGWAETDRGHVVSVAPDIVVTYGFEPSAEDRARAVLLAVDTGSGEVLWRTSTSDAGKHAQRLLDTGGPILLAYEGGLVAVEREDGTERWRLPGG